MRFGIGGFFHETNSFSNIPVTMQSVSWVEKEQMVKVYKGVKAYIGGFYDEAEKQNVDVFSSVMARDCPSGHITTEVVEKVRDRMVELLWEAHQEKPFDALAIHLHGAAVGDGYPDVDGEILRALREKFGPAMPIGVVLDLHGNITDLMMQSTDILVGIKTYPHIDEYGAARIMFSLLCDKVRSGYKTYQSKVCLPWHIVPAEGLTTAGPAHDIQQLLYKLEGEEPELLQASFFQGFPYSDIEDAGASVTTVAKTQEAADRCAMEIARYAWSLRREFAVPANSAKTAFDLAVAIPDGPLPVVINESSDNTGGGAPGDGTHLLREMLERNLPGSAFGYIYDPEVVKQAVASGVGSTISCKLGGKMDDLHGDPVEIKEAYVKTISDGRFKNYSPKGGGNLVDLGLSACLEVGNVSIVVASGRTQAMDDGVLRMAGLCKDYLKFVAVKSSQHFRAWWDSHSRGIVPCDSPGIHCADLTVFDFKYANPDYFPLKDAKWEGK